MDEIVAFFQPMLLPARALAVSILGIFMGDAVLHGNVRAPMTIAAGAIVVAYVMFYIGAATIRQHPRLGLALMELWQLAPLALATVGSAAIVWIAAKNVVPSTTPDDVKAILSAFATGLTAFLTSALVSVSSDADKEPLGNRIKGAFQSRFMRLPKDGVRVKGVRYLKPESDAETWVHSFDKAGISGWGRAERWKRAEGLANRLKEDSEPLPNPEPKVENKIEEKVETKAVPEVGPAAVAAETPVPTPPADTANGKKNAGTADGTT